MRDHIDRVLAPSRIFALTALRNAKAVVMGSTSLIWKAFDPPQGALLSDQVAKS